MRITPRTSLLAIATALVFAAQPPLAAQEAGAPETVPPGEPEPQPAAASSDEILVVAQSLRGEVETPVPPVLELNEQDIAAYGAGSLAELVQALGPATGSGARGGGFPVILVNGTRVSSFRELRSYPPEAIQKVEVFPEEVAQRYGYSPNQRVINIILKRNYSSREIEAQYGQPWDGGTSTKELEGTYLQIAGDTRLNFNLEWNDTSLLTEAERGVVQSADSQPDLPTDPDPAEFRSLVGDTAGVQATANVTTKLDDSGTALSLNATFDRADSESLQGLDSVRLTDPSGASVLRTFNEDDPLSVDVRTDTYSAGATLNSSLGDWQLTGTADGSHATTRSLIDRRAITLPLQVAALAGTLPIDADLTGLAEGVIDRAESKTDNATALVTAIGQPLLLPGGEVSVTLDTGYDWTRIQSEDTRNPGVQTSLDRGDLSAGVNIGIPITSTREDFGAAIGDLNLNLAGGVNELSDFGTLTDWTVGFTWSPFERLTLTGNYIGRDAAPSLGQLGNPEIATPNVPIYDISRNETVLATVVTGGNPFLPSQSQRDWKLGVNWQLPEISFIQQGNILLEYYNNSAEDIAAGFPVLTPEIEAAFPGRVLRNPLTGQIERIDQRPVTYAQQKSQRIQVGLNLTGPFGKARPQAQNNNPLAQAFRAGQGGGGQGGAPGGAAGAASGGGAFVFGGGNFDPQVFQAFRQQLCAPVPEGQQPAVPDISKLPEQMQERLKGADGQVDPARLAEMRTRMCNADGAGGPGGAFNPQRFQEIRQRLCAAPAEGADPNALPDLTGLPEQMLDRLKGPDGQLDPARIGQLKTLVCSQPAPGEGQQAQGGGQRGQGGRGGGTFVFGGPPGGQGGPPPGGGPGGGGPVFIGGGGGGGGGRGPGGGGGDGRGRWFLNIQYAYELENEVLIADGGPPLDLLDGDAISGSGLPRHTVNFNGGLFYAGFGGRIGARYTGPSRIDGSGLPGSTDLFYGELIKVDFRVFTDLNQRTKLIEDMPLLKNTRIAFALENVFDARQRVIDSTGAVPLRFQPFLVDPVGRRFEIEFRKLF